MPYDLTMEFIYRPRPIDEKNFTRRKNILLPDILKLRDEQKRLDKERFVIETLQGIQGYWKTYLFNKEVRKLETQTLKYAKEYKMLEDQAFYAKNVEPMYYYWRLFLGILSWLFTANWYWVLLTPLFGLKNSNTLDLFSKWIDTKHENNTSGGIDIAFVESLLFALLFLYLQTVCRTGNENLGYRYATFTFYSMEPNETLANAFIFNALLNCALQAAIVQYLVESMTVYTMGSNSLLMAYKIKYSRMMVYTHEKKIYAGEETLSMVNMFTLILVTFSIITALGLVYAGANRINFKEIVDKVGDKVKSDKPKEEDEKKGKKKTDKKKKDDGLKEELIED